MSEVLSPAPEISETLYRAVTTHLFREAQWLDSSQFELWLSSLTQDVRYRLTAPTITSWRVNDLDGGPQAVLMDETISSLRTRVQQLSNPSYTIAENPRSFTRRFISNIVIESVGKFGSLVVRSNALVYRSRAMQMEPHLFSMARLDRFEQIEGRLFLARRDAMLDESVVTVRNIAALF
jgi:PAH dioxygenase small subunit